jgi:superfamily I DNA and/or RNA helicase
VPRGTYVLASSSSHSASRSGFSYTSPSGSYSNHNPNSARATALLAGNIASVVGKEHITVITMYTYEVGRIRKSLADAKLMNFSVQTVESFQGKEDMIVVIHASASH